MQSLFRRESEQNYFAYICSDQVDVRKQKMHLPFE